MSPFSDRSLSIRSIAFLAASLALLGPDPSHAQVAVELRAGAAIGKYAPTAAGLETSPGLSWSASLLGRPSPWASLYLGYSHAAFACEEGFCIGQDVTVSASGWGGGVRVHPAGWAWVQGGIARLGTVVDAGVTKDHTAPELGYVAGAGFSVPLFGAVRLVPGVVYRAVGSGGERTAAVAGELGITVGS